MMITHLGAQGDGVAGKIFVPGGAPGDEILLDAQGNIASIIPGPNRAVPPCAHFGDCGGCTLQHVALPAYTQWLGNRILMALAQHDVIPLNVEPAHVSPPLARRRVAMKALRVEQGVILGFNRKAAHVLVDIGTCCVADPQINQLLAPLRAMLLRLLKPKQPASLHITVSDTGLDVLIGDYSLSGLPDRQVLIAFALEQNLARLAVRTPVGIDVIVEQRAPLLHFDDVPVALPLESFTQATPQAEAAMIAAVLQSVGKAKHVADLFCGIGTFTLPLARKAQVYGVEAAQAPLLALAAAAKQAKRKITTAHRDLFRRPLSALELAPYQAVVFDPPRAGAEAQVRQLARSKVPVVVTVSCNPNTFARDAALLCAGGYQLERLWPIGQFLWSTHVELVAQFTRR
jgi:23S rRNA (uracil1939-C5)-methyltransferase